MTKMLKTSLKHDHTGMAVLWSLSSWWMLFPLISLGLFMMRFDRVSLAIEFVHFSDISIMSRLLSQLIDRSPWLESVLVSIRFEDIVFYVSVFAFAFVYDLNRWVTTTSRILLLMHVIMQAVLVSSLAYALQGTQVGTIITVIQVSGFILVVLSAVQIIMIFGLMAYLLLKDKVDELHLV